MWDPGQYRLFGDERARPFYELIARIGAAEPKAVVDVGCGPGELTADLCRRWPTAQVLGFDSSTEMIAAANQVLSDLSRSGEPTPQLRFQLEDASNWEPDGQVDVIVSNAVLQWIPGHETLLRRWAGALTDGGWIAFQMPGNHDEPTHRLIRELSDSDRWRPVLSEVQLNRQAGDPSHYLELLTEAGCVVDAWETTYLHVLSGDDAVLRWIQGTGMRPVLSALDEDQKAEFMAEYGALLRAEYPQRPFGTVYPFRRVFVVAQKGSG
jgi:trans-aconitate 2-methyltransferase